MSRILAGCYRITNLINGKVYIGMSKNLAQRRVDHFKKTSRGCAKLYAAFQKYGKSAFIFEVIFVLTEGNLEDLINIEKQLIHDYDSVRTGYNIRYASQGFRAFGEEWAESVRKRFENPELRKKCGRSGKANAMYGRSRKGERVGGAVTPLKGDMNPMFGKDWRVGKSQQELNEHRLKSARNGELNGCYGSTFQWINKDGVHVRHDMDTPIPDGWCLGFLKTEAMQDARRRLVRCKTTGTIYRSMTEAAHDTGCDQGKISMCCSGKRKKTGGLEWEYVLSDQLSKMENQ